MRLTWRDTLAAMLAVLGGVVVFAKLQSYSWWLIGSWKGALGVIAGIGAAILGTYLIDWFRDDTLAPLGEMFFWLLAATFVVGGLFVTTTKAEFVSSAALVGAAWLVQLGVHAWDSIHNHPSHFAHAH